MKSAASRLLVPGSILALGIGKLAAGYVAQSQALIADGVHSLSDLLTARS